MKRNGLLTVAAALAGMVGILSVPSVAAQTFLTTRSIAQTQEAQPTLRESDTENIYCVGSVSKVYVTAAVMQLVDAGKVELDAPITEYIPEFYMADERYRDITVRMLMNHTSGLMGSVWANNFLYNDRNTERHDTLLQSLSTQRLKATPGEYAAYCNDGFDLLELVIERVTGISYTEYLRENISAKLGAVSTGTPYDLFRMENTAPAFEANNVQYEFECSMPLGAGGVYSVASEVARFGSAFFKGETSLLSENAKDKMAKRWDADEYKDDNGLGWDQVDMPNYQKAGIKVLGKGGDVRRNHSFLLVAPEEKISVAVLSNGGSSIYDGLMAEALLNAALEEKGILIKESVSPEYEMTREIPAEYQAYAGWYTAEDAEGAELYRITFPTNEYMHLEKINHRRTLHSDFLLTAEGKFVELAHTVADSSVETSNQNAAFDTRLAANPTVLSFVREENGNVYIKCDKNTVVPGLGSCFSKTYCAEKIEENPVSEEVMAAWRALDGVDMLLCNDIYSSMNYDMPFTRVDVAEELPGYLFLISGFGTRLLKVVDAEHANAFQTIPSSSNRDLTDVVLEKTVVAGGSERRLLPSNGLTCIAEDVIPEFDASVKEVALTSGKAAWYRISDSIANTTITITRPENSAVYVYNRYGEVVYTTHIIDAGANIPLPKGGKIVFLGETGGSVKISR